MEWITLRGRESFEIGRIRLEGRTGSVKKIRTGSNDIYELDKADDLVLKRKSRH